MTTSTISAFENISYGKQLALFIIAWREINGSVAMIELAERVFAGEILSHLQLRFLSKRL